MIGDIVGVIVGVAVVFVRAYEEVLQVRCLHVRTHSLALLHRFKDTVHHRQIASVQLLVIALVVCHKTVIPIYTVLTYLHQFECTS